MIRLSKITESDLDFARELRNQFRGWFLNNQEVSAEQHLQWYQSLIRRPEVDFRVIFSGDQRVGTVSVIDRGDRFEVGNVIIGSDYRGNGYATKSVKMLMVPGRTYFAVILPHNIHSQSLFQRAGFVRKTECEWELLPLTQEC